MSGCHNQEMAWTSDNVHFNSPCVLKILNEFLQLLFFEERETFPNQKLIYMTRESMSIGKKRAGWIQMLLCSGLKIFAPAVDCSAENILFLDNLACQITQEFHMKCKKLASTLVYQLPPNEMDKCQPVDQAEGNIIKKLMGEELDHYLEEGENLERWHLHLTAGERRILIIKWFVEAWHKLNTNYLKYTEKLFYKTGLLVTADGSEDHRINPEGFENYAF